MNQEEHSIVYGIHPLQELLRAKKRTIKKLYVTNPAPKSAHAIIGKIPQHVQIVYTDKQQLDKMTESRDHQGIAAITSPFPYRKQFFDTKNYPLIVLIDSVQDPRNMGALLRSAYCTNIKGALVCNAKSAPLSACTFKASAGLAEHIDIVLTPTPMHAAILAKKAGYTLYVAALRGTPLTKTQFQSPACLIIGNEETGVTKQLLDMGIIVTIPQKDPESSYNASVAGGIMMFYAASQLELFDKPSA